MLKSDQVISSEEKQQALSSVLDSNTFARSDQLKSFLKYVCEMEIEGDAEKLNEYLIGVEALGRGSDYSPTEDSIVRSRAHALRKKLQEFYHDEKPDAPVWIDLPKGSYRPHFFKNSPQLIKDNPSAKLDALPLNEQPTPATQISGSPKYYRVGSLLLAFLTGAFLTGVAFVVLFRLPYSQPIQRPLTPQVHPALREFWGPLLDTNANVLISVATPAHLLLRNYDGQPAQRLQLLQPVPEFPDYYEWYRLRHPITFGSKLYMHPIHNSPLWGDAAGAMAAVQTLTAANASFEIEPERVLHFYLLRNRNLIIFGKPEYSSFVARLLQRLNFNVSYDPALRDYVIVNREPRATEPKVFSSKQDGSDPEWEVFGLITVLPSEGSPDSKQRTLIFSGTDSAATAAAAEFFSSPKNLQEFKKHLQEDGYTEVPRAYQIVIKTNSVVTLPLSSSYLAHRILQK